MLSRRPEARFADTAATTRTLAGSASPIIELDLPVRREMFRLLDQYFEGVTWTRFSADLAEKEYALLFHDAESRLRAFSTIGNVRAARPDGQVIGAFFSGDTIVDRSYWGTFELARCWARFVFRLAYARPPDERYWFLISSGFRTYRFLTTFFRRFYPHPLDPGASIGPRGSPAANPCSDRAVVETLARAKFGKRFDPVRGIVRLEAPTPLRCGVGDITPQRLADPAVAFFAARNPGHARGDELCCLTRIAIENLTESGKRMVGAELLSELERQSG